MNSLDDVRLNIKNLTDFIKENLNQTPTPAIQAEFNILYNEYTKSVSRAVDNGMSITEAQLILKNEFRIEDELMDQFEEWFSDRMNSMFEKDMRDGIPLEN